MSSANTLTLVEQLCYWRWNKVLPAVYDDSLSQYELLCKIIHKINELIAGYDDIALNDELQNAAIEELSRRISAIEDGDFTELYEEQIMALIERIMPEVIRAHMGIVYPSVNAEGCFVLFSATVMGLSWDVLVTPDDDFGRIVIKY